MAKVTSRDALPCTLPKMTETTPRVVWTWVLFNLALQFENPMNGWLGLANLYLTPRHWLARNGSYVV